MSGPSAIRKILALGIVAQLTLRVKQKHVYWPERQVSDQITYVVANIEEACLRDQRPDGMKGVALLPGGRARMRVMTRPCSRAHFLLELPS